MDYKKSLLPLRRLLIGLFFLLPLQPLWAADLNIMIDQIPSKKGQISLLLFDQGAKGGFPFGLNGQPPICKQSMPPKKKNKLLFHCDGLQNGVYAIFIFHDENNNGKPDHYWYGPPKETIGFSNQAKPQTFGPPEFRDAAFEIKEEETTIQISLQPF